MANNLPDSLGRSAEEIANSVDEVARMADGKIDEAVGTLREGLNKSLDEGVDFERKGATQSKNTRVQQEAETPTLQVDMPSRTIPSGKKDGKPEGNKASESGSQRHKHRRQNEAADLLAANGYKIKHNHGALPNGKNPDYEIEGKVFDCLTPDSSSIDQVRKGISRKVNSGQTDRIVLNLDDSPFSPEDISRMLAQKPKDGLNVLMAN